MRKTFDLQVIRAILQNTHPRGLHCTFLAVKLALLFLLKISLPITRLGTLATQALDPKV